MGGTIIEAWTRHEEISRLPGMTKRIAEVQDDFYDPLIIQKITLAASSLQALHD